MAETTASQNGLALRILIGVAALTIIVAGLRAAQPVLVPLALAAILTIISLPLLKLLHAMRVPRWLAIPIVLLVVVGLLGLVGYIATSSLLEIRAVLPEYVERLNSLWLAGVAWVEGRGILVPGGARELLLDPGRLANLAGVLLRSFAGFMSLVFLVALITLFLLTETASMPGKLRRAIGHGDISLARYTRIMAEIQRYLAIKTATSLVTGLLVVLWAVLMGLDFPLFWGLTAFLFNYVPTVGSLVAAAPAVLLALVQLGIPGAVLVAGGYVLINTLIGSMIEPAVMGRGLGLSPSIVLLSLLFWGWVWGPIGMLLSVPLTMVLKILFENVPELTWVAVLMGPAADERQRTRGQRRWWQRGRGLDKQVVVGPPPDGGTASRD